MQKQDWSHNDLWDLGQLGPLVWLSRYGVDLCAATGIIDSEDPFTEQRMSQIRKILFVNQGWRLTPTGQKVLGTRYHSYSADHVDNVIMTGRVLIGMDQAVRGPWAVRGSVLLVYNQTVAFELQMAGGSAQLYISFKRGG
jgi:hypothetical protein